MVKFGLKGLVRVKEYKLCNFADYVGMVVDNDCKLMVAMTKMMSMMIAIMLVVTEMIVG